jgi:hypothetical protein
VSLVQRMLLISVSNVASQGKIPRATLQEVSEETPQYIGGAFGSSKARVACQMKLLKNNKEMFLFDLQTLGFWGLKNTRLIRAGGPPGQWTIPVLSITEMSIQEETILPSF